MDTALLIVDVQNDYFPGGSMELCGSVEASLRIRDILGCCRIKSIPVVHVQHQSVRPGAAFMVPGSNGAAIHDNVKPLDSEKVFLKFFPNSFRGTGLDDYLKENSITKLVITGMMTHMCIDTTVRAAYDLGYQCIVAPDCCATRDLAIDGRVIPARDVHDSFIAALNGTFARVVDSRGVMEYLNTVS